MELSCYRKALKVIPQQLPAPQRWQSIEITDITLTTSLKQASHEGVYKQSSLTSIPCYFRLC